MRTHICMNMSWDPKLFTNSYLSSGYVQENSSVICYTQMPKICCRRARIVHGKASKYILLLQLFNSKWPWNQRNLLSYPTISIRQPKHECLSSTFQDHLYSIYHPRCVEIATNMSGHTGPYRSLGDNSRTGIAFLIFLSILASAFLIHKLFKLSKTRINCSCFLSW